MAEPWNLTPDEALTLPIDELALLVLRDAHVTGAWNWRNWLRAMSGGVSNTAETYFLKGH